MNDDSVARLRRATPVFLVLGAALAVSSLTPLGLLPGLVVVLGVAIVAVLAAYPGATSTLYRRTGVGAAAWGLAFLTFVAGVGATYVVGDPRPFCDGIGYRGCLTLYGYGMVGFGGGCFAVAVVAGHAGRYRRLARSGVVGTATVAPGWVAVEGRVVPADGTLEAPLSGEEAVWYRHAVEEPKWALLGGRVEVESGTAARRFYVEDGSGRLFVVPDGVDEYLACEFARATTRAGDADGDAGVREGRRDREWVVGPDDAVTVVGRATAVSRAAYPEPVAVGVDGPVVLAAGSREDVAGRARWHAASGAALALLVGGGSLLVMVATAL